MHKRGNECRRTIAERKAVNWNFRFRGPFFSQKEREGLSMGDTRSTLAMQVFPEIENSKSNAGCIEKASF